MTKHFYIATTLLLAASPLCNAMEKQNSIPAKTLAELVSIKEPHSVICFPNNIVAVAGEDGCNVCAFSPSTKNIDVSNFPTHYQRITTHPNKKLLAFYANNSTTTNTKLAIYDIATTKWVWGTTTELLGHPVFSITSNHRVFNLMPDEMISCSARSDLQSFNYKEDKLIMKVLDLPGNRSFYARNPKERELLFITDYNCKTHTNICTIAILQPDKYQRLEFPIQETVTCCKYSPDGSLIALNHGENGCSILNPETGAYQWLIDNDTTKPICTTMAFHPTLSILATLSKKNGIIYYWNFKTQKLITRTLLMVPNEECDFTAVESCFNQRLDFFCDGTKLLVALKNKCLALEVPFAVFKDRCIFYYWLLKAYQSQKPNTMLDDIIKLLMHHLLEISNLHFLTINETT